LPSSKDNAEPIIQSELSKEERLKLALAHVHKYGSITTKEHRTLTGVSVTTSVHDLDELVTQGILRITDQKYNRRYML